jgi:ATP-dependent Clp protease protease subunit
MHQAIGGAQGQAADIVIAAKEIMRQQDILKEILVKHTSQPLDKITHDTDRDFYLNPEQAVEYGIIDEVLNKPPDDSDEKAKKEKK